jgi:hypothetical protein
MLDQYLLQQKMNHTGEWSDWLKVKETEIWWLMGIGECGWKSDKVVKQNKYKWRIGR